MGGQAILLVKKEIRRALQIPLIDACEAQNPAIPIQWGGIPMDEVAEAAKPKGGWISVEINWGDVQVLEIGPNPRFQGNGGMTLVIRTPVASGEDANDAVTKIVASAYPYGAPLVFEGVTVHIDKMQPGAYGNDGAWFTSEGTINWTCYRR